jgi:lactoylglutathione lyase
MHLKLSIFSDGGARGNPGPAAIAYVALNEKGETVKSDSRFIGNHTNNQAEYEALLMALSFAVDAETKEVTCHLDSELVAKQLRGEYAVKNDELHALWRQVQQLKGCFAKISFINVPRSNPQISKADELVNKTLDEAAQKGSNKPDAPKVEGAKSMFVHASIRTSNMQRSIDFYTKFFGLKVLSRKEIQKMDAEITFMQDAEGKGCKLELTCYHSQKEFIQAVYEDRLFDHLGFEVLDINKTLVEMRKANVTITDEPYQFNETTTIAFVEDPDGTLVELIQRK